MHQSCTFSIQLRYVFVKRSGTNFMRPSLTTFIAFLQAEPSLTNHCGVSERLNRIAAAVAAADVVAVRLDLDKVAPLLLEVGNDGLAPVAVNAVILAAVYYLAVLVDALYLLKVMAQADLIVVGS